MNYETTLAEMDKMHQRESPGCEFNQDGDCSETGNVAGTCNPNNCPRIDHKIFWLQPGEAQT